MKIYQTKPVSRGVWIWIGLLTAGLNLLLSVAGILRRSAESGWVGSLLSGILWVAVLAYVALYGGINAMNVRKKRLFLTISGSTVLVQRMNFCLRIVNRQLLNLNHFTAFSSRSRLGGKNWIFGTLRKTGKPVALMNVGLYEKNGTEVAALFNETKGPVVAHFREEGLPS